MAIEIRTIPVLTGNTAERFVQEAEENARNPKPWRCSMTREQFKEIWRRSQEQARKRAERSGL